jgi:hypothetical protein
MLKVCRTRPKKINSRARNIAMLEARCGPSFSLSLSPSLCPSLTRYPKCPSSECIMHSVPIIRWCCLLPTFLDLVFFQQRKDEAHHHIYIEASSNWSLSKEEKPIILSWSKHIKYSLSTQGHINSELAEMIVINILSAFCFSSVLLQIWKYKIYYSCPCI